MISILSLSSTGLIGSNQVLKCCHSTISLIISKQLLHTLSDVLAIYKKQFFYVELMKRDLKIPCVQNHIHRTVRTSKSLKGRRISKFFAEKKIFYSLVFDNSESPFQIIFFCFPIVKILSLSSRNDAIFMQQFATSTNYEHL